MNRRNNFDEDKEGENNNDIKETNSNFFDVYASLLGNHSIKTIRPRS